MVLEHVNCKNFKENLKNIFLIFLLVNFCCEVVENASVCEGKCSASFLGAKKCKNQSVSEVLSQKNRVTQSIPINMCFSLF